MFPRCPCPSCATFCTGVAGSALLRGAGATAHPLSPALPLSVVFHAMEGATFEPLSSLVPSAQCGLAVPLYPLFVVCHALDKMCAGHCRGVWCRHEGGPFRVPCFLCSSCATHCTRCAAFWSISASQRCRSTTVQRSPVTHVRRVPHNEPTTDGLLQVLGAGSTRRGYGLPCYPCSSCGTRRRRWSVARRPCPGAARCDPMSARKLPLSPVLPLSVVCYATTRTVLVVVPAGPGEGSPPLDGRQSSDTGRVAEGRRRRPVCPVLHVYHLSVVLLTANATAGEESYARRFPSSGGGAGSAHARRVPRLPCHPCPSCDTCGTSDRGVVDPIVRTGAVGERLEDHVVASHTWEGAGK